MQITPLIPYLPSTPSGNRTYVNNQRMPAAPAPDSASTTNYTPFLSDTDSESATSGNGESTHSGSSSAPYATPVVIDAATLEGSTRQQKKAIKSYQSIGNYAVTPHNVVGLDIRA